MCLFLKLSAAEFKMDGCVAPACQRGRGAPSVTHLRGHLFLWENKEAVT